MNINSIGTILKIGMIALSLIILWFLFSSVLYILAIIILGYSFDIKVLFSVFFLVILYRMFVPRNVFINS